LDFLTVFFIVAGCALLWLNLRPRGPRIVITKADHQSAPTPHIPDDAEIRVLIAALNPPAPEARPSPEAQEAHALAKRIAEGWPNATDEQLKPPIEDAAPKPYLK